MEDLEQPFGPYPSDLAAGAAFGLPALRGGLPAPLSWRSSLPPLRPIPPLSAASAPGSLDPWAQLTLALTRPGGFPARPDWGWLPPGGWSSLLWELLRSGGWSFTPAGR